MAYTPMMQQYLQVKSEYQDAFLFFRLGDFYEMFFDDALKASQLLEITLTSRDGGQADRIPMCGVPYHSAAGYIDQLIARGHKVAICEQMEDAKQKKGMVRREVVRLITPGTHTDGKGLDSGSNMFLGAAEETASGYSLAYADVSTGEAAARHIFGGAKALIEEARSLRLRELVVSDQLSLLLSGMDQELILSEEPGADAPAGDERVAGCPKELHGSILLLLSYINRTQKQTLPHIQPFRHIETDRLLSIDFHSKRNLELTEPIRGGGRSGTLLWLLDETATAMGSRKLRQWLQQPLAERGPIEARQRMTAAFITEFFTRDAVTDLLKEVYDLERLSGKISFGSANGRDLAQLRNSLLKVPAIIGELTGSDSDVLRAFGAELDPCEEAAELLTAISEDPPLSPKDGGVIRDGYSERLDEYRYASRNGKDWIAQLEAAERQRTGIKSLKIGYNRVFGYYIEVTKSNLHLADLERYERKQTLANAERFITPELKEKETLILTAEEESLALEYELFSGIREQAKRFIPRIQTLASRLSELDVFISFASVAEKYRFTKPSFHDGTAISIKEGRHPVVEKMLNRQGYVPNDCEMPEDRNMLLITGPNMSGKSTYMRQIALTVIMAQTGSYVPTASACLPVTDQIFTRIGAADDLTSGQSTFMVEMMESRYAITHATDRSLLLFDEIGRGTSTYDGMALAQAMIEYVHEEIGANTLFSTHYHELTALSESLDRLANIHASAMEQSGKVVFLHKMKQGPADKSYGIHVAELAELPAPIIQRAHELLREFESDRKKDIQQEPAQLSLFDDGGAQSEAAEAIRNARIPEMTPLEALQLLNELQQKLNS
ncbi:DNA mismatch repair protein MutS [Indiicoccus explosivorum]|uniref:DNA mismatch repair protein MutS n=1 Tax=Indiicoccus explosivorum TaxID=1917864 RepID=UPI000B430157|nr:DNA mismatch repair protein MutS [Indiicoccus explosivorum]